MRVRLALSLVLLTSACSALDLPPASEVQTGTPTTTVVVPDGPGTAAPIAATVRVAAVQTPSRFDDPDGNRRRLTVLIRRAALGGAKIVVLPECAITGYLSQDLRLDWHVAGLPLDPYFEGRSPFRSAETVPGPSTVEFGALARELGIWLTIPFVERADSGTGDARYFNTVCLASPDGEIVAHYRKLTPWPFPEQAWASPGDRGVQTAETPWGRVGLAICFDVHTILDRYQGHGLWALLYPIAWVSDGSPAPWFRTELPARVRDAGFHVIGANWSVERDQRWQGYGYSTIIDRHGTVVAQARTQLDDEIVYADLPVGPVAR